MRAAARIFAIAAVVVAGFGVWKLYGLDLMMSATGSVVRRPSGPQISLA